MKGQRSKEMKKKETTTRGAGEKVQSKRRLGVAWGVSKKKKQKKKRGGEMAGKERGKRTGQVQSTRVNVSGNLGIFGG